MTDIDFDELDKAVTNLMGNVGKERTDDTPQEKVFNINTTLKPDEKPVYGKLDEVAKNIGNETVAPTNANTVVTKSEAVKPIVAPAPSLPVIVPERPSAPPVPAVPRPSSGRFMDVVRSSSDTKTASRVTASISSPIDTSPQTPPLPDRTQPQESKTTPATHVTESIPLTPFLPGAKVEKRPLGGDPVAPSGAVPSPFEDVPKTTAKPDDSTPEPVKAPEKTPEITTVEPTNVESNNESTEEKTKPVESNENILIPEEASESIRSVESIDTEKILVAQSAAAQKKESNSPDDPKAGNIYDVKNYHQPLGHPVKQKSGWGVVFIIIGIIILAAALGAAAYFILGLGA